MIVYENGLYYSFYEVFNKFLIDSMPAPTRGGYEMAITLGNGEVPDKEKSTSKVSPLP